MLILKQLNLPSHPIIPRINVLISSCLSQPPPVSPLVSQYMMWQTLPVHSSGFLQRKSEQVASMATSLNTAKKEVRITKMDITLY